ncbi:hypothetical protein AOX55_00005613 (plasmid) [Sinorhizobium fredii CCBAU 25509]|nr:hypothetical protein AOX55_00005613 [Sinorhizobium fredii CCBAU 25509]
MHEQPRDRGGSSCRSPDGQASRAPAPAASQPAMNIVIANSPVRAFHGFTETVKCSKSLQ